ncbi:hypothetical protein Cgig2_021795 [Carnegiea gigantea]|uniref:Uncharacterized protein n=1 Tax=Carnegiea gigantea TaxID=171969 RepID=A0A9Q1QF92_9CARY|nr:hypothetical protein Cgig2_021795 [Carnegiea gigantea]
MVVLMKFSSIVRRKEDLQNLTLSLRTFDFAWCNSRENGINMDERLDCFCRDTKCLLFFLMLKWLTELIKWNRDSFGHVGSEIHKLESQLKNDKDAISRRHMLGLIREWRKREQILWWQRARSDYLKYRDASTCWFHSTANMRRAKNTITSLFDANNLNQAGMLQDILFSYGKASE